VIFLYLLTVLNTHSTVINDIIPRLKRKKKRTLTHPTHPQERKTITKRIYHASISPCCFELIISISNIMQRKINTLLISPYKNNANTGKATWIKIVYTSSHAFLDSLRSLHTCTSRPHEISSAPSKTYLRKTGGLISSLFNRYI
jgi:hypothetical protein